MSRIQLSRVNPRASIYAAIPGGTVIGPVIEVHIVKILDSFGLEIAMPSPNDSRRTSYVLISRGKIRGRIAYSQCRTWNQRGMSKTGIQVTGVTHVTSQTNIQETCADILSISPQPSVFLHTKNHSYDREKSCSCQFVVWRSSANSGLQNGYQIGASSRSR